MRTRLWSAAVWLAMLGACSSRSGDGQALDATGSSGEASEGDTAITSTDEGDADTDADSSSGDELKYDLGPKYDIDSQPPDPFAVEPLGCGEPPPGALLDIEGAAAFLAEDGTIRLRLVDSGPEHWWDISIDLPPAMSLPADYLLMPFVGDLSVPGDWEWWHGTIMGSVDLTLVSAELDGCLVAEITASTNNWGPSAPPLGWVATTLQAWP